MKKKLSPLLMAAGAAIYAAPVVYAQSSATLEEVVVTARKRAESLQDTPIAVTALSADELNAMGAVDFESLQRSNPNVSIIPSRGQSIVASHVSIRGNVQTSSLISVDESVGVYVDGVIHARSYGMGGILVDVESVQTLKGPQGTLFGRNTTGGAMLIKTQDPDVEAVSGRLRMGYGELGSEEYVGAINVPVSSSVAVRVVYAKSHRDGFIHLDDGRKLGDQSSETGRVKLLWHLNDRTTATVTGERVKQDGTQVIVAPGTQPNRPRYKGIDGSTYTGTNFVEGDVKNYRLTLARELDNGELKFLVGRREYTILANESLAPGLGNTFQDKPDNDDTAFEIQYNGSYSDDRLQLTSGIFYFDETIHEDQLSEYDLLVGPGFFVGDQLEVDTKSRSGYIQGTYGLTDQLDITVGGRYTQDKKDARLLDQANNLLDFNAKDDEFNYLVTVSYKMSETTMAYASTATGYRAGGPSNSSLPLVVGDNVVRVVDDYGAETLTNYEVGFKGDFFDQRLRLNAAVFYQDYSDYQYVDNEPREVAPGLFTVTRVVKNTDAIIKGGELELTALLPADFELGLSYGHTKAEISDSVNPNDGDALPQVPRTTWSVNLKKPILIGHGVLALNANYSWRDSFSGSLDQLTTAPNEAVGSNVDDVGLLNLTANYELGDWIVGGYVRNATNEKYVRNVQYGAGGALNQFFVGEPRIAGMNVTYNF